LTGVNMNAALNTGNTTLAPTACKPTVTIYSYLGTSSTWGLYGASVSTGNTTFTLGSLISTTPATCTTSTTAGSSCSLSANGNLSQGALLTLQGNTNTSGAVAVVYTAFSCQ
jgi:hypothetical protein